MKKRVNDGIVFVILCGIFFTFYYVFAKYGIGYHDFRAHAIFAGELMKLGSESIQSFIETTNNSHILAYPGWHICFLAAASVLAFINSVIGGMVSDLSIYALAVAVVNTLLLLCTFFLIRNIFMRRVPLQSYRRGTILAAVMLFVGPLYIPGIFEGYYLGPRTGNIWHNPTYLIIKPMAVLIFFLYADIFEEHAENNKRKENKKLILGGVLLCVSAILKPSFFQMFLPALFVFCLFELIQKKGKNFWFLVKNGFSVVPVTIIAICQMIILGGSSGGGSGISIGFLRVWGARTSYWYIALILSLAFPIYILIMNRKKMLTHYWGKLGIVSLISGMFQYMFLYVTKAPEAGDFGWGFALSIFLIFVVSVICLEKWRCEAGIVSWKVKCAYVLLCLHFLFGIIYFYDIFKYLRYTLPLQF